jgi:hypothetical protein
LFFKVFKWGFLCDHWGTRGCDTLHYRLILHQRDKEENSNGNNDDQGEKESHINSLLLLSFNFKPLNTLKKKADNNIEKNKTNKKLRERKIQTIIELGMLSNTYHVSVIIKNSTNKSAG